MEDYEKSAERTGSTLPISGRIEKRKTVWDNPIPYDELPDEVKKYILDKRSGPERKQRSILEILEGKHMLSLIVYIDSMSPVLKSDIYNNISRSANIIKKIEDLEEMGLISIYRTARTNMNVVVITDKGRVVADFVRQMVGIVNGGKEEE